jgi:hypothetical protein
MHTSNAINSSFSYFSPFSPETSTKLTTKHQETVAFLPSASIPITNEKLLSDRNVTASEVTTFLRQQAQLKLQAILDADRVNASKLLYLRV